MATDKREERLLKVLSIVTDWLKFAESKNAIIIGFNGASIYGISKALELNFFKTHCFLELYLGISIVFLVFSTVICLLSFVPQLNLISSTEILGLEEPNSIFFEHLKKRSELQIMQSICETNDKDFSPFEKDIASQIKQNSKIASKKYSYFKIAVWITVCAYISPILTLIFALVTFGHKKQ